jgi:penicillin amidase
MIDYLEGINQYMDVGLPIEFQMLGIKKEKFTIKKTFIIFMDICL